MSIQQPLHLLNEFSEILNSLNRESVVFGLDEAGAGTLISRVYAGCVWWNPDIKTHIIKDSKKYANRKYREEAYDYIINNAIAWSSGYVDETEIDEINIRNARIKAMHKAISSININPQYLIVDGDAFKHYIDANENAVPYSLIIEGDAKYTAIAAASVIAKVEHDKYIKELCAEHPELDERYGLLSNYGYGTATHMAGLKKWGPSIFHRKTFAPCK